MTTEAITPLRQRMIEDMNARKLCAGTQRGHIRSCKRFAAFLKRSPDTATCEDIRTFQLHLADTGISICNRNRIMTGLRFLFRVTLRRLDLAEEIYHLREPEKLALVMSVDEIKRLLAVASSLKTRVLLSLSMARAGSRPDPTSSSRCGCSRDCSVGCFCRSLWPPIRPESYSSSTAMPRWSSHKTSPPSWLHCATVNGWSTASARSAARRKCCAISRATPTASPSQIAA
jgi:hypothetical protein